MSYIPLITIFNLLWNPVPSHNQSDLDKIFSVKPVDYSSVTTNVETYLKKSGAEVSRYDVKDCSLTISDKIQERTDNGCSVIVADDDVLFIAGPHIFYTLSLEKSNTSKHIIKDAILNVTVTGLRKNPTSTNLNGVCDISNNISCSAISDGFDFMIEIKKYKGSNTL